MRVGQSGSNQVQNNEVNGSKQTGRANAASSAKKSEKSNKGGAAAAISSGSVSTDISAKGKDLAKAKEVAKNAPDIREEKVAELRRRIAEGKYRPDPEAIADRMIGDHLQMSGIG